MENDDIDLLTWRGLVSSGSHGHPLFFFNACEVGQAQHVANFVDGWAPGVLEAGAGGYIGGLWALDDQGAAEFASHFYNRLREALAANRAAPVADVLRETRQQFYENGNPTFLAYVYYSDPNLRVVKPSGQTN